MVTMQNSLKELHRSMDELLLMPLTEINVDRLNSLHGSIKALEEMGYKVVEEEPKEVEELEESLEAVENYFTSYMDKKREYELDKTEDNRNAMIEKLKLVLMDMTEAVEVIWSSADTAEEKQFITQFGAKVYNLTR